MKKITLSIGFLLLSISYVSASSCIDLQDNLIKGNDSDDVLILQNFLFEKGLLTAEPNGHFGPMTLQAIKKYQDKASLPDNGDVLTLTREAIKKETCDGVVYSSSNAILQPVECIDLQNNLITGKKNDEVLTLQNFLKQRKLLTVIPNGYFGPSTLKGVKSYQSSVGLTMSGAVLSLTRQAIKDETCVIREKITTASDFPPGCSSSGGYSIFTGNSCSIKISYPDGCTSFYGFSVTTGLQCSSSVTPNSTSSEFSISGNVSSSTLIQGIVVKSFSNGNGIPFLPKSTHVKLGTVTLTSQLPVTLKSLTFTLQGVTALVTKVTNFTITDAITGKVTNGGLNFLLQDENVSSNVSKVYELYANIADIDADSAGGIDIWGNFTVNGGASSSPLIVPVPKFTIAISY